MLSKPLSSEQLLLFEVLEITHILMIENAQVDTLCLDFSPELIISQSVLIDKLQQSSIEELDPQVNAIAYEPSWTICVDSLFHGH